jgi:hypothetical protein
VEADGGAATRSGAAEVGGDADGAGGVAGGCGGAAAGPEAAGRERGGVVGREPTSPGVDRVWATGSGQTGGPGGCWGGPSGGGGAGSKAGTDADRTSVGACASGVSGSGRRPPRRSVNRRISDGRSGAALLGRDAGPGVVGISDLELGGGGGGGGGGVGGAGPGAGRGAGRWVAGRSSGVAGVGAADGPDVAGSVRPAAPLDGCRRRRVPRRGPASTSRGSAGSTERPPGGPVAALESARVGVESELPVLDPGGPPRPWVGWVEGAAGADGPAVRVGSPARPPGWTPPGPCSPPGASGGTAVAGP